MSDKPLESAAEPQEPQGLPVPAVSGVSTGQPTSVNVDEIAEKVAGMLRPVIEKTVQSTKDRRFAKLEEYERLAEQLKAAGGDPREAARRDAIDNFIEREGGLRPAAEDPGRSDADTRFRMQAETEILLSNAGIAADDTQYAQLVSRYNGKIAKPEDWKAVVNTFVESRKKQAAPANPAQVITEGRPVAPANSLEEADQIAERLSKLHPVADRAERDELKKKLREMNPPKVASYSDVPAEFRGVKAH